MSRFNTGYVGVTAEGDLPPQVRARLGETTPYASTTSVPYWVSPTGSDAATGELHAPFRTLAKAVSMIPDVVRAGHKYTINLLPGDFGNEELQINNRLIYGDLLITGTTGDREQHRVHRVRASALMGRARFENITATRAGTLTGPAWWFEYAGPWIDVYNVKTVAVDPSIRGTSGVIGLLADYGSTVNVTASEFNGRRYGLRANFSSRVYSRDNTGTGNIFGAGARWGGIMNTYGTQPGADTTLTTDSGGIISQGMGAKVGVPAEMCLVEAEEGSQGRFVRKRWLVRQGNAGLGSRPINEGQKLRLAFQKTTAVHGPHQIDVSWSAVPLNASGDHFIRTLFGTTITDTEVRRTTPTVLARAFGSGMSPDAMTQISHSGANGVFYIDCVPASAQASWYGVDVEISNMRDYDAPTLLSVTVV